MVSAGAGGRTPIFDTDPDEFQRIMDNTLRPVFLAVRYAAGASGSRQASVIVISSISALSGTERVAYCGAKAGVIGMVKAMALDFADKGVRVNAICPGYVETPLSLEVAQLEDDPEAAFREASHASDSPPWQARGNGRTGRVSRLRSFRVHDRAGDSDRWRVYDPLGTTVFLSGSNDEGLMQHCRPAEELCALVTGCRSPSWATAQKLLYEDGARTRSSGAFLRSPNGPRSRGRLLQVHLNLPSASKS